MKIAKPEETEMMYEKNMKLLTPWIRESMDKISKKELEEKVVVTYNDEGYPVCCYRQNGILFHITSEHPVQEAKIWCDSIPVQGPGEIILYGTGFGYSLFELFANKMPHTLVVVFEENLYLFKAMLYYFDLSPLIETQKIVLFIGDSDYFRKAFMELFYSLLFLSTTSPAVISTLPALRNFKKEYMEIHRNVFKELSLLVSCIGNSHNDNMVGLRNMLGNTRTILENPHLDCLKDKYRNVPVVIVSNGPSLDLSIPLLKKMQGKCLMICVESAIVPLTKNGIIPDILAVVERTKYTYLFHFKNRSYSPHIALLSLAIVDPRVFPSFSGEKIPIFRKRQEMSGWFCRSIGNGVNLDVGANVAHLAASIAIYLGADPIVFVGQDYAYGPDGATHSKDAVVSQAKQGELAREILHSYPTIPVEGNDGKTVLSNELWVNFRLAMEHIVANHPEHVFYNATQGGAKIHGTKQIALQQFVRQYCTKPLPYQVNELIAESRAEISIAERRNLLEKFIVSVVHYAGLFRSLACEMNRNKLECEKMMMLCLEDDSGEDHTLLNEAYQKHINQFYQYMKEPLCRSFFQQLICAYFFLINRLGVIDTQEKRAQAFDIQRQLYRDLRTVSQSISVTLDEGSKSLKALSKELREKGA